MRPLCLSYRNAIADGSGQPIVSSDSTRRFDAGSASFASSQTRALVLRLLGALLMEMDDKWATGHCYLDMQDYWVWRASKASVVKQLA